MTIGMSMRRSTGRVRRSGGRRSRIQVDSRGYRHGNRAMIKVNGTTYVMEVGRAHV